MRLVDVKDQEERSRFYSEEELQSIHSMRRYVSKDQIWQSPDFSRMVTFEKETQMVREYEIEPNFLELRSFKIELKNKAHGIAISQNLEYIAFYYSYRTFVIIPLGGSLEPLFT